jgi:copper oxidase (laccase) domain-containing protein
MPDGRAPLGGVLEAALEAMEKLGASRTRIIAAIGPCISQDNYEVNWEFRDRFLELGLKHRRFFVPSGKGGPLPLRFAGLCRASPDGRPA